MRLVCKSGDLALVVHDEPIALANIGKVVRVKGPLQVNKQLRLACWLIEPVNPRKWCCVSEAGIVSRKVVKFATNIEHPDAWLLPLRLGDALEACWTLQPEVHLLAQLPQPVELEATNDR